MNDGPERRPLRIAVDARPLAEPPGGLRRYLECILPALLDADPGLELHLIGNRKLDPTWRHRDRVTVSVAPWPMTALFRPLWESCQLPARLARLGADIFFSGTGVVPAGTRTPSVVTFHDLAFLKRPDLLPWRYRIYWRRVAARLNRARSILVPSSATRHDLIELTSVDPHRVHVVPSAGDPRFRPADAGSHHRSTAAPDTRFVFWIGTREPRKNLGLLLEAMELLNAERHPATLLVLAGPPGWGVQTPATADWVRDLGRIDDATLLDLYRTASVFAFPSTDEGFGLPVVEAMACGCPVAAADAGSLPEIVGDAGILLPPTDPRAWADAIARIIDNPDVGARLATESLERASRFSWSATAQQTLDVFHRAARS